MDTEPEFKIRSFAAVTVKVGIKQSKMKIDLFWHCSECLLCFFTILDMLIIFSSDASLHVLQAYSFCSAPKTILYILSSAQYGLW